MENELKVGDRVIFTDYSKPDDKWENYYGVEVGGVYCVESMNPRMLFISGEVGRGVWAYYENVQKITGKETELEKLLLWRNYVN
jgi:hypothetical protein